MGVKFSFSATGAEKLIDQLASLGPKVVAQVDEAMEGMAERVVEEAKARAPRGTGALINSIGATRNESLEYEIYASKYYAPYVEFGTGTLVDVPKGLEEYAMQFYVGPGVNIPAHPFLFPAYEEERKRLVQQLRQILADNLKSITVIAPR